jgi:hypothetical protein
MNEVYYKLLLGKSGVEIITMQWFDEHDYDQRKLLPHQYETEQQALEIADKLNLYVMQRILNQSTIVCTITDSDGNVTVKRTQLPTDTEADNG